MDEQTKKAEYEKLVNGLAEDLKPSVEKIEAKIATTKNHYGDYMGLLSSLSRGNNYRAKLLAVAMIRAGANREGVLSALQFV